MIGYSYDEKLTSRAIIFLDSDGGLYLYNGSMSFWNSTKPSSNNYVGRKVWLGLVNDGSPTTNQGNNES